MQILNLDNLEKSDIKYSVTRFPDTELQITLEEFSHKDNVEIHCRITTAEELFILMQVADILKRHGVLFDINIYYLMGMRMDRVMDFNRPFTLKIITNILDSLGATRIHIFSPHSDTIFGLTKTDICKLYSHTWGAYLNNLLKNYQIVLPDDGAVKRRGGPNISPKIIIGEKVRDIETGRILSIKVKNPEAIDERPLIIVDDLCDGGGTFIGLAKAIKQVKPNAKISIVVDHMVNPEGMSKLASTFEHVWFTNSYADWKGIIDPNCFPKNVTQFNIF